MALSLLWVIVGERRGDEKGNSEEKSMWGESMAAMMIFIRLPLLFISASYSGEKREGIRVLH